MSTVLSASCEHHAIGGRRATSRIQARRAIQRVIMEMVEARQLLSAGSLDETFAVAGLAVAHYADPASVPAAVSSEPIATYALDNGQVLMAGTVRTNQGKDWAVAKFNADGSLDASFGSGGWAVAHVNTNSGYDDDVVGLTVDGNGGIIVAGNTFVAGDGGYDVALVRFNPDGTWDNGVAGADSDANNAFGTGGVAVNDFNHEIPAHARAVAMQGNQIIVAADSGFNGTGCLVARYTAAGTLDTGFGGNNTGWNLGAFADNYIDDVFAMALDSSGNIFLGGDTYDGTFVPHYSLMKFAADGALNGMTTLAAGDPSVLSQSSILGLAVDAGNEVVAVGQAGGNPLLMRFDNNGVLNSASVQTLSMPGGAFNNVLIQTDGKILAVGIAGANVLLARFQSSGAADTTFGDNGISTLPLATDWQPAGAVIQTGATERLLVGGRAGVALDSNAPATTTNCFILAGVDLGMSAAPENTPPTIASLAAPAAAVRGFDAAFSAAFTDPDAGETYAITWDFGDGATLQASETTPGSISASHVYAADGSYSVQLTISDGNGGTATSSVPVVVQSAGIVDGNLLIGGEALVANAITVTLASGGGLSVYANGALGTFSPSGEIIVRGGDAGNVILVAPAVTRNVLLFGGAGADMLRGGSGGNVLVGNGGSDLLMGGRGRNLMIGGSGGDILLGSSSDDILIGGSTRYDNDPIALAAMMAEWSRTDHTYAQRVYNLSGDSRMSADRSNGNYFLRADASDPNDITVYDDTSVDILIGGSGKDWFLSNKDSGVRDVVLGLRAGEFSTDIDPIVA